MSHPILAAACDVRSVLKAVADANPTFMSTGEKAAALRELVAAEAQVAELRLRILADAGDLAADTAAKDAAGWLAQHTRTSYADARADLRLADALDRDRPVLAAAMREGARVAGAGAGDRPRTRRLLPAGVDAETVALAEAHLVDRAGEFGPKELGRIGRRILDVVAPEIAEAAEAARLADLEAHAEQHTRLTMRRLGDGTTRISSRVPDAAATRFATYLEAYTNPRRRSVTGTLSLPVTRWPGRRTRSGWARRSSSSSSPSTPPASRCTAGTPPPSWSPSPSTRSGPTSPPPTSSAPDSSPATTSPATRRPITAAQARRLACTAKILPVVLGGDSLPLDLGRTRRLYSPAQRKALLIRDRTCRAEGCDVPGTWCEAHHHDPWHTGGHTDLADGVLFCSHHHHQAHEPRWRLERLPNGDHRFHPRR